MIPSWIRSSSVRPWPWYRFAIETTRRRFELTSRSFASLSPSFDPLGELDLLRGGQQRIAPGLVQEELERVGRRRGELHRSCRGPAPRARASSRRSARCRATRAARAAPPRLPRRARASGRSRAAPSGGRTRGRRRARAATRSDRGSCDSPSRPPACSNRSGGRVKAFRNVYSRNDGLLIRTGNSGPRAAVRDAPPCSPRPATRRFARGLGLARARLDPRGRGRSGPGVAAD